MTATHIVKSLEGRNDFVVRLVVCYKDLVRHPLSFKGAEVTFHEDIVEAIGNAFQAVAELRLHQESLIGVRDIVPVTIRVM